MTSFATSSYFLAGLLTCVFATGCSSRPKPVDVALSVESTKPGTEYHIMGTVDLDGKPVTVDQKTPYRFAGNGMETNAKLVSNDADCNLLAKYESGADWELTSRAIGPIGCEVIMTTKVKDRSSSAQILVKALPTPSPAPVAPAASTPAASAPVTPAPAAEATPAPVPAPDVPVAPTIAP